MKNFFLFFSFLILFFVSSCQTPTTTTTTINAWFNDSNLKLINCDTTNSLTGVDNWYKDAVFYHIWIKAFNDSNNDGIGDLNGITQKLDYLNDNDPNTNTDLAINAIWLSPVFECSYKGSNMHGYDTTDYYKINSSFGTEADLINLLKEAHKRGIRVIFDFVPNHTSNNNQWFIDSRNNANNKRDWFIWDKSPSNSWQFAWGGGSWSNVWHSYNGSYYYAAFDSSMPDLNFNNIDVRTETANILIYWFNKGFDGARLDAVRYLFEDGPGLAADRPMTHEYCKQLRTVTEKYKLAGYSKMMVGEIWTDASTIKNYYGDGTNELNMCFNFPLAYQISNAVTSPSTTSINNLNNVFEVEKNTYPAGYQQAVFLSNHDNVTSRPMTQYSNNAGKVKLASAICILAPGTPFIYYGNEIGMTGLSGDDINLRQSFTWNSVTTQGQDVNSILSWNKYLIKAKLKYKSLKTGTYTRINTNNTTVLAFLRKTDTEQTFVVLNFGSSLANVNLDFSGTGITEATISQVIGTLNGDNTLVGKASNFAVNNIPSYGIRVFYIGSNSEANIATDVIN